MKFRLVIICAFLANVCFAQSQTDEGSKMVGGYITATTGSVDNLNQVGKNNSFTLAPFFGFFPKDNLAIGIQVVFTNSLLDNKNQFNGQTTSYEKTDQNLVGLSPFIRYYVPVSPKFKFYAQLNAYNGFGKAVTKYGDATSNYETKLDVSQFGVSVNPGLTFFATKNLGLDASFTLVNYNKYRFKSGDTEIQNNDNFSFKFGDVAPNIGASFYF